MHAQVYAGWEEISDIHSLIKPKTENFFYSKQWLSFCDAFKGALEPRPVAVFEEGELAAATPAYLQKKPFHISYEDLLAGRLGRALHRIGAPLFPALIVSSPLSFSSDIIAKNGVSRAQVFAAVRKAVDAYCSKHGVWFSSFPFLSKEGSQHPWNEEGYQVLPSMKTAVLHTQWKSFSDYVASLKSKRKRRNIPWEKNRFAKNGYRIEVEPEWEKDAALFSKLFNQTFAKHTTTASLCTPAFFKKLYKDCAEQTHCFVARNPEEEISGYCMFLGRKEEWHAAFIGMDYATPKEACLYANLAYHAPIEGGIAHNVKKINYRPEFLEYKKKAGCSIEPLYLAVKCHQPLVRPFFPLFVQTLQTVQELKSRG